MENAWEQRAAALATIYPRERLEPRAVATIDAALGGDNAGAKSHHQPATHHQPGNGVGGDNNADSRDHQPDSHNNGVGGGKIALACSGGSDSIALLLLAVALFPGLRERLCVLHLDHALRGSESAGDAEFVATVARELGVDSVVGKIDWQEISARDNHGRGLVASEEFLRGLRLEFFAREMRARNCKILLQGHQRNDVEELLLMRLSRGAGVGGLSAPRPVSPQSDGRIFVRPLLSISKPDIEAALRSLAIPWRQDATNAGCDYFRNRVRHNVLPALATAAPFVNIARSRMLLEEADDFLELATNDFLRSGKRLSAALPRALLRRAIIKILDDRGATISAKNLDALVESIATTNPIKFSANKDFDVCWDGGDLRILKRNPATTDSSATNPSATTNPGATPNPIFTTNPGGNGGEIA
ncbi:MAG: tRNA lysidine(34) synthetase TilS, partial [Opitutae bacterium]|nr:tRNA lysidine(34) synthetase TilS [Opitutae bacterium]